MDINCILHCAYQKDGKCRLTEINPTKKVYSQDNSECPYFEKTIPATQNKH